jgi:acyl-CoA reductase-like NAD-dependent aldehyde dehydrogenase
VVGHPFEASTQVAPLIHDDHRASVEGYVATAVKEGGEVLAGGSRPQGTLYDRGVYFQPTVIAGLRNDARVCREEIFGPVLAVMPFDDEEDAIGIANDNEFGLACGIWTRDAIRARRVGRQITTGTVWINTYKQFSVSTPFGGAKNSGIGREKGALGVRAYMNQKSYYYDLSGKPHAWARAALGAL